MNFPRSPFISIKYILIFFNQYFEKYIGEVIFIVSPDEIIRGMNYNKYLHTIPYIHSAHLSVHKYGLYLFLYFQ